MLEIEPGRPGWARRPRRGLGFGESAAEVYHGEVADLFAKEGDDKGHASWLLELLVQNPKRAHRLDHPIEAEVTRLRYRFLNYAARCAKKGKTPNYRAFILGEDGEGGGQHGGPKSQLPPEWEQIIVSGLEAGFIEGKLPTPNQLLQVAINSGMTALEDRPENEDARKKFKTRVGNLKRLRFNKNKT